MRGRPSSPRPAGQGVPWIFHRLLLSLEVGSSCVASTVAVRGRPASPRPAGLALAHLGLSLLYHVDHELHISPQVGLGLD